MHTLILICTHKTLHWWRNPKVIVRCYHDFILICTLLSWYAHFYLDMHTQNFALVKEPQSHCQMLPWFYLDMHTFILICTLLSWYAHTKLCTGEGTPKSLSDATMILSWYAHFYLDMHTQNFALVKEPQSHCQMLPWFYLDMHTFILICTLLSWYAHTKLCTGEGTPKSLSDATMILSWYAHFYLDMHTQNFALVKEPQSHCQMLPWFYLDMHTFKIVKNKQKLKTELARVNMYKLLKYYTFSPQWRMIIYHNFVPPPSPHQPPCFFFFYVKLLLVTVVLTKQSLLL